MFTMVGGNQSLRCDADYVVCRVMMAMVQERKLMINEMTLSSHIVGAFDI